MHLLNIMEFGYKVGVDPTVTDFYESMAAASRAATETLATRMRYVSFERYTQRKDYFQLPRMFGGALMPHATLLLSRGFADTAGMTVRYASNMRALRNGDAATYFNLMDLQGDGQSDHTLINGAVGTVYVEGVELSEQWVEVAYTGGLYVASDDLYENVPGWLSEAAMAQASINLMQNRALTPENGPDLVPIQRQLADLIAGHGRFLPQAVRPVASSPER